MADRPGSPAGSADSLLGGLLSDCLDPGYRLVVDRRAGAPAQGRGQTAWLVAGALVLGMLLGAAARHAAQQTPVAAQTTRDLAAEVVEARERTEDLGHRAERLTGQVESARRQALAGDAAGQQVLAEVARLELAAAAVPVTGSGLRVTVADPPAPADSASPREQTVLDRDLQVLLNALWLSGAEAVALGGVRLHPLATVRQAGGAMLVDDRPVAQPYLIEVIGDPERLQTRLVQTDGYGRFRIFAELYRVEFVVEPAEEISLAAGSVLPRMAVPASPAIPNTVTPTSEGNR